MRSVGGINFRKKICTPSSTYTTPLASRFELETAVVLAHVLADSVVGAVASVMGELRYLEHVVGPFFLHTFTIKIMEHFYISSDIYSSG